MTNFHMPPRDLLDFKTSDPLKRTLRLRELATILCVVIATMDTGGRVVDVTNPCQGPHVTFVYAIMSRTPARLPTHRSLDGEVYEASVVSDFDDPGCRGGRV